MKGALWRKNGTGGLWWVPDALALSFRRRSSFHGCRKLREPTDPERRKIALAGVEDAVTHWRAVEQKAAAAAKGLPEPAIVEPESTHARAVKQKAADPIGKTEPDSPSEVPSGKKRGRPKKAR